LFQVTPGERSGLLDGSYAADRATLNEILIEDEKKE
jgi:hypothetical protein